MVHHKQPVRCLIAHALTSSSCTHSAVSTEDPINLQLHIYNTWHLPFCHYHNPQFSVVHHMHKKDKKKKKKNRKSPSAHTYNCQSASLIKNQSLNKTSVFLCVSSLSVSLEHGRGAPLCRRARVASVKAPVSAWPGRQTEARPESTFPRLRQAAFIKSCQRLEIRTAIFNPASIRVCNRMWAWDGTARSGRGRTDIYCAASSSGSEGIQPFFPRCFFLPLFIHGRLTEHTPASPRAALTQSNIFVAGCRRWYGVATENI